LQGIKNIINEFMSICRNEKANSIVVFIICHGVSGRDSTKSSGILPEDGFIINSDWMIEQFMHKKLSGHIPMLFFIDACRYGISNIFVLFMHTINMSIYFRGPNKDFGWKYCSGEDNNLQNYDDRYPIGTISDRRYEDVFIAYATLPGKS